MSSSAFTPSTTTVTNNVPVNVPVVTGWETYQMIIEGSTTNPTKATTTITDLAQWRRIGQNMEIMYTYVHTNNSGAAAGSGLYLFNMPNIGVTIDNSKLGLPNLGGDGDPVVGYFRATDGTNRYNGIVQRRTTLNKFNLIASNDVNSDSHIGSSRIPLNSAQVGYTIFINIPIAEWAGSGTTTLATRAVEEYASNTTGEGATNGSTYSNSAFFRNGPEGSKFPNIGTVDTTVGSTKYYIQWQSPQLATDNIIIEMKYPGLNTWTPVTEFPQMRMGSSQYGISYVATSATQGYVQFGRAGSLPAGASYGATGNAWNNFYSATDSLSYYWRVRKVSSGATVGFPVSARNIVGDTSGSVVPVGMLGERIFSQASGISVAASNTIRGLGTLSFQAGTWMIFCSSSLTWSGDPNGSSLILSTTSATSNVFTQLGMTAANVNDVSMSTSSNPANTRFGSINGIVATFTSQTTVFVNIYSFNSVSSSNASYSIWAIRIA